MHPATATRPTADDDTSDAFSGITADTTAEVWDLRSPAPERTAADAYRAMATPTCWNGSEQRANPLSSRRSSRCARRSSSAARP